ncbi:hypothetical protein [Tianweitania sediminis]|jgi:hypothetical protein|uniref:Uncharacterized protein n=1 Tax=Tianweitania sediminis TaxID=1502156 RepID=A0A8J7QX54_9HYPH|nr:hypothetical protein [Tianweitania sediminis]MBP0437285.1 hypothetical protein [Tianweitania sediminis]HEV7417536.1 hypothetical protein [Tianweitania sediminis]
MPNRAQIMSSAAALLALLNMEPAAAQGLDSEGTIDAIVQAPVREEEQMAAADPAKVVAAIDKTEDNISVVRKITNLDRLNIVFLADATLAEGGPPKEIEEKLAEKSDALTTLRQEMEGNALLYHAINSRQVLMRDVLGIDVTDNGSTVVVYAAAKPASGGAVQAAPQQPAD